MLAARARSRMAAFTQSPGHMTQRPSCRSIAASLFSGACALAGSAGHAATPPLPAAAVDVIAQVNAAASRKDFNALAALMTTEFVWSYGGDASATGALANWESHPLVLKDLQRITSSPCVAKSSLVECGAAAKGGYRAGFKQTPAGWRMVYFVQGD